MWNQQKGNVFGTRMEILKIPVRVKQKLPAENSELSNSAEL